MLQCRVNFLDDTYFVWALERNALGQDLFNKVCEHLDLLERDYYGLVMWDSPSTRVWLDCAKEIRKQIKSPVTEFFVNIKFYPPDPSILAEDITRYLLCLQLRKDILIGRLPCPPDILALLGSYTVQSTIGDYDPNLHKNNYVSEIVLAPNQSEELGERIMELHSTYRFMNPAQADKLFLENAMGLPMYGVDLHPAKDVNDADVMLGVCSEGLMVYEDEIKTNIFLWPRVLKISHKRSTFLLKMRPSEQDEFEGAISFSLANYRACKQLWKCCVEHHSFFRNRIQDKKTKRLLTLGSRFRYHGCTQSECLEASGNITRAPPRFTRFIIKRKGNEEILDVLKQPIRTELDDWFLVYGPDKWRISTSDDVMLESEKLQEWKHHADDWCVLLDGSPFLVSGIQQPLQTEEQREDVEVVKGSEERLTDEHVITQTYKVQVIQEGSDIIEKELHEIMKSETSEIMKPLKETPKEEVLEVNRERIQRVVITKKWTQEVNSLVESQEDVNKKIERVEMLERRVMITEKKTLGSEDTFERMKIMEQRLEEVDTIERKLVEVEELRFGLQDVESLEQRLQQVEKEELQRAETDDWYILLDRMSLMPSATRTGGVKENLQQIVYNPKPMKKYDDWYILFDVLPQTMEISYPLPDVSRFVPEEDQAEEEKREVERKIQQELVPPEKTKTQTREEVIQSRVKTEEVQKEQHEQVTEDYRRPQPAVLEQRAAEPQIDKEDDWFVALDGSPKRSVPSVEMYEETREEEIQGRVRIEQIKQQEQVDYGRPQTVILEQKSTQPQRDVEDDWFIIFDVSPKGSVPSSPQLQDPTVELYEETREEVIQSRVRKGEQVIEVTTVSAKEQIIVPEKKRTSIIQTPQFLVVARDIDDDWFQLYDKVPYEQKSFPSDVRSRDFEMIPVGVQEVDDDWFDLLDTAPPEMRSVPSVSLATEEHRMKEQEDRRMRLQQMRVREEEEKRLREQEKRKQELEARRAQPAITVKTETQPQIEKDDDWFILFDVSPKEIIVADVLKVDRRAEEEKRRREEERRKQIQIEERTKKTVIPEKKTVQLRTEVEDNWFILMGDSPKDYVPTLRPTPVISPVAPPKPRPQIPTDQPLTSTPTAQPVSITKTYQEKTKYIWNITLESESEIEPVLMRKIRRSEGESVYIRHSILMLEDFDVSHEMILKHYASITELKRDFMEVKQDFGPTEWDRRLSSYSPTAKAQFLHANEEILMRMGLIEDNGKTVWFRPRELIYV
ncbi:trichohyalin-like [Sinocyclocheilus rhinocerous]|uniref:trichohyalin-like n=1 Tax=Sinocyclocheilus rhinocerous TaxID=307959 RepID=UPI0007B7E53D|nr:PREDICTED: trichohyalin-like [Sinocyclocheilus rhinocerous]